MLRLRISMIWWALIFLKARAKNTEIATAPTLRLYDDKVKGGGAKKETKIAQNKS